MPMRNAAHPGEIVRECMESKGWTVTECAAQLGVSRITLSRLLNGRAGVSTTMALALERIGWSNANHWDAWGSRAARGAQMPRSRRRHRAWRERAGRMPAVPGPAFGGVRGSGFDNGGGGCGRGARHCLTSPTGRPRDA